MFNAEAPRACTRVISFLGTACVHLRLHATHRDQSRRPTAGHVRELSGVRARATARASTDQTPCRGGLAEVRPLGRWHRLKVQTMSEKAETTLRVIHPQDRPERSAGALQALSSGTLLHSAPISEGWERFWGL